MIGGGDVSRCSRSDCDRPAEVVQRWVSASGRCWLRQTCADPEHIESSVDAMRQLGMELLEGVPA